MHNAILLMHNAFSQVESKDLVAVRDEPDNSSVDADVKNTDPYRYIHVAVKQAALSVH